MAGSPIGVSFKDIAWVEFARLDDTGKLIADAEKGLSETGVYHADGDGEGATTANITGLEEKGTPQYANGKVKRMTHGAQTPSLALTMLDMDAFVMNKMKGYVPDGKGGYVLSSGKKPHIAVIVASKDFDGNLFYDCFANGEMIEVAHNHGTNTNAETDYNGTFEYDAMDPLADGVFTDDMGVDRSYKNFYSADPDFDEAAMYEEVFGGYKLPGSDTGDDLGK
ncbi:phage tail protein [Ligilactobacillus acidipiscis]|uniref:phage tail protein n=1 Tax=Ligilactobacillus acidipiscis TaxID=89059 RepID=UPI0022E72254|nr:phage tail protein [Ligilactobacillus acidipiscis]